jgi:hypothetical protein
MKFKKSLLIICLLACVLFAVGSVSAGDVNDTAIASDNTDQIIEQVDSAEAYSSLDDEKISVNNETSYGKNSDDSLVSTDENDDILNVNIKDVENVTVTIYKQTGKYASNKKIYFKIIDADTGAPIYAPQYLDQFFDKYCDSIGINYKINGNAFYSTTYTNKNGIGVIEWESLYSKIGTNTFEIEICQFYGEYDVDGYDVHLVNSNTAKTKVTIEKSPSKKTTTTKTTSKKTTKSTLSISAPKVTKNYKKSGVFKVTVKNQKTKKAVKGITLKIKVYTNSKYKTYTLKTNKNGVAKINTKSLKKGTHKVVVTAKATKKYKAKTVKSSIKIIKKQTTTAKNGKIQTTIKVQCDWHLYRSSSPDQVIYDTFKATLTGKDGKALDGEYKALIAYYRSGESSYYARDKIEGYYGSTVTHEVGQWYYLGTKLVLTIEFAGNDKYAPTTFTKTL